MKAAILTMNVYVNVKIGMRIRYDCPAMSMHSGYTDAFFKRHRSKTGTIVEFKKEPVGLLDTHGRTPGLYVDPSKVIVRFDGEEDLHTLGLDYLTLLDCTDTGKSDSQLHHQKVSELPCPIDFYPGDVVYKRDDLLQYP